MPIKYNVLGDMGSVQINVNAGVTENLALFNASCNPVPSFAFNDIRLRGALEHSRIENRCKIDDLFLEIYAKRSNYSTNSQDLLNVLNNLAVLLEGFRRTLARHELITSLRNLSYDDVLHGHHIDFSNDDAAWIRSQSGIGTFSVGRTNPSAEDIKKYGIEHVSQGPGMETKQEFVLFKQVWGSLGFPGGTGVHGTVIGFTVNDHRTDGANGWWGIVPKANPLGKKDVTISVQSEGSKGMHWGLDVWYIPTHLYNG
ncbi:hypothetical protein H4582DRAFT_1934457 [Lactarius indigo]|nr:hypothetical protein H4582DRAFT_1934457 [Lactarius indigo]